MIRNVLILICFAFFLAATGCAVIVAGTAAGASVFSYYKGELIRSYPESYAKTTAVCLETLEALKITVVEKEADSVKTVISAKQTDGTPVSVKVTSIAPRITEVSVRSGLVGVWDKKVSELIHATIAQKIQP